MRLLTVLIIAAVIFLLEKYSIEHCFDGISYALKAEKRCCECNETVEITSELINRRRLPVLYLKLREYFPREIQFETVQTQQTLSYKGTESAKEQTVYLMPGQKGELKAPVKIGKRGRYVLGSARITCGDLLGIKRQTKQFDEPLEIIVYPERADLERFEPAFGSYLGSVSVQRFIMPDPIQISGFREYTGREPQKDIAWAQSLKRNKLMVRQYDYTSDQKAAILVDIEDASADEAEYCYALARSTAELMEEKHIVFSFATDAVILPAMKASYIPDGTGYRHLEAVKETLGRAGYACSFGASELLKPSAAVRGEMRSYILISAHPEKLRPVLAQYERMTGMKVFVISAQGGNQA